MSGYNADISQPAEKDDENTPAPVVETVAHLGDYQLPSDIRYTWATEYKPLSKDEMQTIIDQTDMAELSVPRLLATIRFLKHELRKDISADDSRIQHIWEQAGELANDKGYCEIFDDVMDALGTGYARQIDVTAWVDISIKIPVPLSMPRNGDVDDYLDTSWVQEAFDCQEIDLSHANWEVDWVENN